MQKSNLYAPKGLKVMPMEKINNRNRHTASFLISHFLNSKESLRFQLNGNYVSILRRIGDVIDMTFNECGKEQCKKSNEKIAIYSRTSIPTVKRALAYFEEEQFLFRIKKIPGAIATYELGNLIKLWLTMTSDERNNFKTEVMVSQVGVTNDLNGSSYNSGLAHHDPGSCDKDANALSHEDKTEVMVSQVSVTKEGCDLSHEESIAHGELGGGSPRPRYLAHHEPANRIIFCNTTKRKQQHYVEDSEVFTGPVQVDPFTGRQFEKEEWDETVLEILGNNLAL